KRQLEFADRVANFLKMFRIAFQLLPGDASQDFGHASIPGQLRRIANAEFDSSISPMAQRPKLARQRLVIGDDHASLAGLDRLDASERKYPDIPPGTRGPPLHYGAKPKARI